MVLDDVVGVIAMVLGEAVFDFEVFPFMACVIRGNIINTGYVRAYLYKDWFSLLANFIMSLFIFIVLLSFM
jgi:hypothetical protein